MAKRTEPLPRHRLLSAIEANRIGASRLLRRATELVDIAERLQKELDDRFYT